MGLPKVTTKLSAFGNSEQFYEAVFLVDTGATDSMVPGPELEKIGVKKEGKMAYELADGTVREYPFGLVRPSASRCLGSRRLSRWGLLWTLRLRH
jgi:hypothetical protein